MISVLGRHCEESQKPGSSWRSTWHSRRVFGAALRESRDRSEGGREIGDDVPRCIGSFRILEPGAPHDPQLSGRKVNKSDATYGGSPALIGLGSWHRS